MSSPTFTPSAEEQALVSQLFARGEPHKLGVLTGEFALDLFSGTDLSAQVLSEIWAISDKHGRGSLSPAQTAIALRLIGWAQVGVKATPDLLEKPGPLAHIPGVSNAEAGPSRPSPPPIPPLAPGDKAKFHRLFINSSPVDGLIDGDKARDIFAKSKLSIEHLSQIWELADPDNRGALDSKGFIIALHLIQGLMSHRFSDVPAFLPNELYEQAAAPVAEPIAPLSPLVITPPLAPPTPSGLPFSPNVTSPNGFLSPRTSFYDGSLSPISTSSHYREDPFQDPGWNIPSDVRAIADRQFDALDPQKTGFIEKSICFPFLLQSNLPHDEVAQIWTLADPNDEGKVNRDAFAVALYLLDERRRGHPIPTSPPPPRKALPIPIPPPNEQEPQPPPPPAKPAFLSGSLHRQSTHIRYPSAPTPPNLNRLSASWSPQTQPPELPVPPLRPHATQASPHPHPPEAVEQMTRRMHDMQKQIIQLRRAHAEKLTTIANLTTENVSLRVVIEELQAQVASHDSESQKAVREVLARENEALRGSVQELQGTVQQLQAASSDVEMQRIQYDDLVVENERLNTCITEMRESTTQLPWSGGDSELQTLINEDLARENARLRTEAREMQENVAQLQEATAGLEEQRRANAELVRERQRMEATMRTMQTNLDVQRRDLGQLSRDLERLRVHPHSHPQPRHNARAPPARRDTTDLPPPAYNEFDPIAT
ncbi:hypothetical protein R3P38DRAFT_2829491 [Favolaschia claudopus]|uniref:EH domain-containing protein n=1 Tax=Favolaschia claudopus TaxID=2862362 RepID=A0AAW0EB55_9AGAR